MTAPMRTHSDNISMSKWRNAGEAWSAMVHRSSEELDWLTREAGNGWAPARGGAQRTPIGLASIFVLAVGLATSQAADRLPALLEAPDEKPLQAEGRQWTVSDLVELREITSTAVCDKNRRAAFVIQQAFADSGGIRFALYPVAHP